MQNGHIITNELIGNINIQKQMIKISYAQMAAAYEFLIV